MKKKKLIFVILLFIFIVIGSAFFIKYSSWSISLTAALSSQHNEDIYIIHQEKIKDGSIIVLYHQFDKKDLSVAFVKKFFNLYKVVYSGVQGDIDLSFNEMGFNYMFFPRVRGVDFPIYLGIIENPDITQMKVADINGEITKDVKLINTENYRIWLLDMTDFADIADSKVLNVQITAYSEDGHDIIKQVEDELKFDKP